MRLFLRLRQLLPHLLIGHFHPHFLAQKFLNYRFLLRYHHHQNLQLRYQ
jgi:hypothetical protein